MARPPRKVPAAPAVSTEPLPEALAPILARRGLTVSALWGLLRAEGLEVSRSRLHQLVSGQGAAPSPAQMERLASVLGVSPGHFAEYRLWRVRALLDPGVVGFHRAMVNLERVAGPRELAPTDGSAPPLGDGVALAGARYPPRTRRVAKGHG